MGIQIHNYQIYFNYGSSVRFADNSYEDNEVRYLLKAAPRRSILLRKVGCTIYSRWPLHGQYYSTMFWVVQNNVPYEGNIEDCPIYYAIVTTDVQSVFARSS